MKVLEEKQFSYEFTCKRCGSKCEAEAEDVAVGDFGSLYDSNYKPYVVCPVCDGDHTLPWNLLTPKVERMARAKKK